MKTLLAAAASTAALALAGCNAPPSPAQLAKLDCPKTEHDLTLVSAAPDGKSCAYSSAEGAEVTLRLTPVDGGVEKTLASVETALRAGLIASPGSATPDKVTAASHHESAQVAAQAEADAEAEPAEDTAPAKDGKWEVAHGDGDHARVDLPGVHIDARDDSARVRVGPIHIDADDGGAEIRMQRDVRLRGESLSREKRGVRATLILTGDELPGGYGFAGYEAGGPKSGPLAVATVKGKAGDPDELYEAVKALVRRNGGV